MCCQCATCECAGIHTLETKTSVKAPKNQPCHLSCYNAAWLVQTSPSIAAFSRMLVPWYAQVICACLQKCLWCRRFPIYVRMRLRFLCTETPQELQQMLQELSDESRRMGLKMNIAKTKVMVVDNTPININNVLIENVQGYVYLGQHYSLKEKNQDKEIQRRIMAGWAAYAKHRDIFKSNLAICLKRQVYNYCVLPAMTYGAETWTLTKQAQNKLAAAQTKMERSMLNITYKDRKTNIWVRERTKVIDIINTVRKNEMVLGRAYQPPQRRPMDLACHQLETI